MGEGVAALVVRVVGIAAATIAFAAFLVVVNYPYVLDWIPLP